MMIMKTKKIIALLLSFAMLLPLLPLQVLAEELTTSEMMTISGKFIVDGYRETGEEPLIEARFYSNTATVYRADVNVDSDGSYSALIPKEYVGDYELCFDVSRYGNVVSDRYYYSDANEEKILLSLTGEDVSGIDITLEAGYAVSGTIELPEDMVFPEREIECTICCDKFNSGSMDKYYSNVLLDGNSTPFVIYVPMDIGSIILALAPHTFNIPETNLLSDTVYFVNNEMSSEEFDEAGELFVDGDVSGVRLYPMTGNVMNVTIRRPETITQNVSGTLRILDENGERIDYEYFQLYTSPHVTKNFTLNKNQQKIYIYFCAQGYSGANFDTYREWLYLNPDGSFSKTFEEAVAFEPDGITNIDFTVPDENYFLPKIKVKLCFEDGAFLDNGEIEIWTQEKESNSYSPRTVYNSQYNDDPGEIKNNYDFVFAYGEGTTDKYIIGVDVSCTVNSNTNLFYADTYYYSDGKFVTDKNKAEEITPEVFPDEIIFEIPNMKKITGKIVSDGTYKNPAGMCEGDLTITCAHNTNDGGDTYMGEVVEVMSISDYSEEDCSIEYYSTPITVDSDMNFSCYVPVFISGTHTLHLKIGNVGNIVPGWYDITDENGEDELFEFSNGMNEEDINFDVKTGYLVSGVVQMPEDGHFEPSYNRQDFTVLVNGKAQVCLSDKIREAPFSFVVQERDGKKYNVYSDLSYGAQQYTNLYADIIYYVDNDTVTTDCDKAKTFVADHDVDGLVINLKTGIEFIVKASKPDEATGQAYGELKIYDAETNEIIFKTTDHNFSRSSSRYGLFSEYSGKEVYFSYDIDDSSSSITDVCMDEIFVGSDGVLSRNKVNVTPWVIEEESEISFVLATENTLVENSHSIFTVLDRATKEPIESADIKIIPESEVGAATNVSYSLVTDEDGVATIELDNGLYNVETSAVGYNSLTELIEKTNSEKDFIIYLDKKTSGGGSTEGGESGEEGGGGSTEGGESGEEGGGGSTEGGESGEDDDESDDGGDFNGNVTFWVKDTETLEVVSGAQVNVFGETDEGKVNRIAKTDADGKVKYNLVDATYNVQVYAKGYHPRSVRVTTKEDNREFIIYINKSDIIKTTTYVNEMSYDEIIDAGIDPDAYENKQFYNCTAVFKFSPEKEYVFPYICAGDEVVVQDPIKVDNTMIEAVSKDVYLIVKSQTSWLKEIFEVQLVSENTSSIEVMNNFSANLNLPEGLSFATMVGEQQSATVNLGSINPKGSVAHSWYITGDKKGDYLLNGTVTATRTAGGVSEDFSQNYVTKEPITVLAGDAMTLNIEGEKTATAGQPYKVKYTLENVSNKTLYNISMSAFDGKFSKKFGAEEFAYSAEYGDIGEGDFGNGFTVTDKEFKPGEKLSGTFEITFGENIELEYIKYILDEMFILAGTGSTTEIPRTVNYVDEFEDTHMHIWDSGTVTKAATCTEEGTITYVCLSGCGLEKIDTIPATGHSMGIWMPAVGMDPCVSSQEVWRRCYYCGYTETYYNPPEGHKWGEVTVDVAPTCTEPGFSSRHCSVSKPTGMYCDAKTDITYIEPLGHLLSEWTTITAATCTSDGLEFRKCTRVNMAGSGAVITHECEYEETRVVESVGHNWDDGVITVAPTETSEGKKVYTCKNGCGETFYDILPKLSRQEVSFITGDMVITYGERTTIYNQGYNDSDDGATLVYSSSNENVATVDSKGKVSIHNAGETVITATAPATEIYLETSVSYKLTVKKAPLTVKASDAEIFYGEVAEPKEYDVNGFVLGEDESVLDGTVSLTTDYEKYMNVGSYNIVPSGFTANNYIINYINGKLTVKKAISYTIELSNLTHKQGNVTPAIATITPQDATAEIVVDYREQSGVAVGQLPTSSGSYIVNAYLAKSDNIEIGTVYATALFVVVPTSEIKLDDGSSLGITTQRDENDNVEFVISDEELQKLVDNIPSSGNVILDAKSVTKDANDFILPSKLIEALNEQDSVKSFTIVCDEESITMDEKVLETLAENLNEGDKLSVHIDSVDKTKLNDDQKNALDAIAKDAVVLELNIDVMCADGSKKEIHELGGEASVTVKYSLPVNMQGKKIVVCYIPENGEVSYNRATYKDGYLTFETDHFSYFAIFASNGPAVSVSEMRSMPGKEVQVTLDVSGNTGFANLSVEVGYDSDVMTLSKVVSTPDVGATFSSAPSFTKNPYNMSWDSISNNNYNGTLATLTFKISEDAPDGIYPITVDYFKGKDGNYTDGVNVNYDEKFGVVGFVYISGGVTVATYIPGDINGDECVDSKDATFLLRYLAGWNLSGVVEDALDVDGSKIVDSKDATNLLRYLAGWELTLH